MFEWFTLIQDGGVLDLSGGIEQVDPAQPIPELPAECWNCAPVDAERAHAATLALCRGAA